MKSNDQFQSIQRNHRFQTKNDLFIPSDKPIQHGSTPSLRPQIPKEEQRNEINEIIPAEKLMTTRLNAVVEATNKRNIPED